MGKRNTGSGGQKSEKRKKIVLPTLEKIIQPLVPTVMMKS